MSGDGDIIKEYYYRVHAPDGLFPQIMKFEVIRHTPRGVYILDNKKNERYICYNWRKAWAYPDRKHAILSFIRRRHVQISIITEQLRKAYYQLELAQLGEFIADESVTLPFLPKSLPSVTKSLTVDWS
jgi:hypothetical protein